MHGFNKFENGMAAEIIEDLHEINRRLCYQLWDIADVNSRPKGLSPRLLLPQKRDEGIRISEQESKILYCGLLNTLNYYYSIETPTEKGYQQTGKSPKSARTDLSLYVFPEGKNKAQKVANVEFKAHNPEIEFIRKDIEKMGLLQIVWVIFSHFTEQEAYKSEL